MSSLQRASDHPIDEGDWKKVSTKKTTLRSHSSSTMARNASSLAIATANTTGIGKKTVNSTTTTMTVDDDDSSASSSNSNRTTDTHNTTKPDLNKNSFAILENAEADDEMEIDGLEPSEIMTTTKTNAKPRSKKAQNKHAKTNKSKTNKQPALDWDEMSPEDIDDNITNNLPKSKTSNNKHDITDYSSDTMDTSNYKKRTASDISTNNKKAPPQQLSPAHTNFNQKEQTDNNLDTTNKDKHDATKTSANNNKTGKSTPSTTNHHGNDKSNHTINTQDSGYDSNQDSSTSEWSPQVTVFRLEISTTKNKAAINNEPTNLIVGQALSKIHSVFPIKIVPIKLWKQHHNNGKKVSFEDDPIIAIQDDLPLPNAINFTDPNDTDNFLESLGEERHPDTPKCIVVRFGLVSDRPILISRHQALNSFFREKSIRLTPSNFTEGNEATIGWLVGAHPTATNRIELEAKLKIQLKHFINTNATTLSDLSIQPSVPNFKILRKQIWANNPYSQEPNKKLFTNGLCIRCEKSQLTQLNNLLLALFNTHTNDDSDPNPLSYIPFSLKFKDYPHFLMAARNQNFLLQNTRLITYKGILKQNINTPLKSWGCSFHKLVTTHCAINVHQSANFADEVFLVLSTDGKLSNRHTMEEALHWLDQTLPSLLRQLPLEDATKILANTNECPARHTRSISQQSTQPSLINFTKLQSNLNDTYDRPPTTIAFNNSWTDRSTQSKPNDASVKSDSTPRTNNTNSSPVTQPETLVSSLSTQIDEMRNDLQTKINHLTSMIERLADNQQRMTNISPAPFPYNQTPTNTYQAATSLTTLTPREYRTPAKGGARQR